MQRLILIRHATAIKNIEDRHGGCGTSLVPAADTQISELGLRLCEFSIHPTVVYASDPPQSQETARFLGEHFGVPVVADDRLRPLDLGVLGGLSNEEARKLWPGPASCIAAWRRGEIEICDLAIPNAENYDRFYERGADFIKSLPSLTGDVLIVGTRSILILLISVLLGRTAKRGGGYREIPMDCCACFTFERCDGKYLPVAALSTGRLNLL
jgi:broad specificity phosphatase PhoE